MLDLFEIMDEYKQLNINEFFQVQKKGETSKSGQQTCKIEIPLVSDQFSIFSDVANQWYKLDQMECGFTYPIADFLKEHVIKNTNHTNEVSDGKKRGKFKDLFVTDESERYIVEYTFIDFEYMIIGLKIKDIEDDKRNKEFNDFDLSKLMI